jgi:dimethylaniline monooxygenase (N-oxide forming)
LDADSTVGGVWSASRVYPGLIADSPVGLFEFADMTMVDDEHPRHGTITGQEVHEYLQKYAEKIGLLDRITFNTRVSSARRKEGGWQVTTEQGEVLDCEKLIVASGLSSKPSWPDIPNDGFKGPVIHSVSLGTDHPRLTGQDIESVAVLGGCKSSIEAANICLNAGKMVYWVIRDKGSGAGTIIILNHQSKIKLGVIALSRLFSTLFPSIFNIRGFSYQLLHSGKWKWGAAFLKKFWTAASKAAHAAPGYEKSSNGLKIRPEIEKEGLVLYLYRFNAKMLIFPASCGPLQARLFSQATPNSCQFSTPRNNCWSVALPQLLFHRMVCISRTVVSSLCQL